MVKQLKALFNSFLPTKKPDIDMGFLLRVATEAGVNIQKETCIIGIRGFYNKGANQRMIYDDAIFILSPTAALAFNANVDPGAFKTGIANLKCGSWLYKIGIHGISKPKMFRYKALVQAAPVVVSRDNRGTERGWFAINIHKGGYTKVSSLGCQTIHPSQWNDFISNVEALMKRTRQGDIKYILKEMIHEE